MNLEIMGQNESTCLLEKHERAEAFELYKSFVDNARGPTGQTLGGILESYVPRQELRQSILENFNDEDRERLEEEARIEREELRLMEEERIRALALADRDIENFKLRQAELQRQEEELRQSHAETNSRNELAEALRLEAESNEKKSANILLRKEALIAKKEELRQNDDENVALFEAIEDRFNFMFDEAQYCPHGKCIHK